MLITLDHRAPTPLYQQIVDAIRGEILTGQVSPGIPLPSIRQLAQDLRISVITTKRAYQDLEMEGLIETRPGRGTFVAPAADGQLREARLGEVRAKLEEAVSVAHRLGVTMEEAVKLLEEAFDPRGGDEGGLDGGEGQR